MCGGTKTASPPPAATAAETASQVYEARMKYDPLVAQQQYDILTNPNYGVGATTQAMQGARESVFPGETALRDQLLQTLLGNLQSPTGISSEQQQAQQALRDRGIGDLQRSFRNRANVGGGLYGGRSQYAEQQGVSDLLNAFVESDINREQTNRNNAISAAFPALQILYPEVGITPPQFESAVPSANNVYQGGIQTRGQDINYLQAQQQQQAQLRSALYNAIGSGVGAVGGAAFGAGGMYGQKIV